MKILIFSASTGGGHKRAAAALEDAFKRLQPEAEVTVVDRKDDLRGGSVNAVGSLLAEEIRKNKERGE